MFRPIQLTALLISLALGMFVSPMQAAVVIDSLDNTITATSNLDNAGTSGKAVNFIMPAAADYSLDTVVLYLSSVDNNESPLIQIWSHDGTSAPIGSLLETLANPGTLVNGLNTFTSSGLILEAGMTYWVVARNTAGLFGWSASSDTSVDSDIGATHNGRVFPNSSNAATPGSWTSTSSVLNRV
jgi:hypothetical protein